MKKNKHIGSSFDAFLEEENVLAETEAKAIKAVIAWQIENYLKEHNMPKSVFARDLKTSRAQIDRLLDVENTSINLKTLASIAATIGKHLEVRFV